MERASTPQQHPAAWYPDANSPGQLRWWDGTRWTEQVQPSRPAPHLQQPQQLASKPRRPWYRRPWVIVVGAIVALVMVVAAMSPAEKDTSGGGTVASESSSNSASGASKRSDTGSAASQESAQKPNEATDDNTPHVGPDGKVTVDGLEWSLSDVRTAQTIGDPSIGTDAAADGVFVIATLKVHSTKGETATLMDDVVQVEGGKEGAVYSSDTDGSTAAMLSSGSGDAEPFFLEDIQPDTTAIGTVVFDVPQSVLASGAELRFNELGFGETHAYIRLP